MEPIYSTTALTTKQREVKDAARKGIVHITENGNGAFIFCAEDVFAETIERAREEAAYEARIEALLARADEDFAAGRFSDDLSAFKEAVREERNRHA